MAAFADQNGAISVSLSQDGMAATLVLPPRIEPDDVSASRCRSLLEQAGVEWTPAVEEAVDALVADPPLSPTKASSLVVAQGTPPQHGEDGYIRWAVQKPTPLDPSPDAESTAEDESATEGKAPASARDEDDVPADYYNCSAFVTVKQNQLLGTIVPPTAGVDGRDVTGCPLPAEPGTPAPLDPDETILVDETGRMTAQISGLLLYDPPTLQVSPVLDIPHHVDFSTGNIDFEGPVIVREGVRDRFTVASSDSIEVYGLIEAATLRCDGDLHSHGGMVGREHGRLQIGGSVYARYLDSVHGKIAHDLHVERELINCRLLVQGSVQASSATIIGGRLSLDGSAHINTLGSPSGVRTEISLGSEPAPGQLQARLDDLLEKLDAQRDYYDHEHRQLQAIATPTDRQRRQLDDAACSLHRVRNAIERARDAKQKLSQNCRPMPQTDIRIERQLFHGVTFVLRDQWYRVKEDITGPIRLFTDPTQGLLYQHGRQEPQPIAIIATTTATAA